MVKKGTQVACDVIYTQLLCMTIRFLPDVKISRCLRCIARITVPLSQRGQAGREGGQDTGFRRRCNSHESIIPATEIQQNLLLRTLLFPQLPLPILK